MRHQSLPRLTRTRIFGNWYFARSDRLEKISTSLIKDWLSGGIDHALIMLTYSITLDPTGSPLPIKIPAQ